MERNQIPLATVPNQALVDHLVRTRHFHSCGQMIWIVDLPDGFVCYDELRPIMPMPITVCPRCGEDLTRDALTQRQHTGAYRVRHG
jgi:predicted RNA-binding Zn-ribbon protein involved in translation (DUF1610 family)